MPAPIDLSHLMVENEPAQADLDALEDILIAFNYQATGYTDGQRLAIFLRDPSGQLQAGLAGFTWGGYGMVQWLWVREDLRGQGVGSALLARAEAEAARRGCRVMNLDTHSFQAPGFYQKLGYRVTGVSPDSPAGYSIFYLQKTLLPAVNSNSAPLPPA